MDRKCERTRAFLSAMLDGEANDSERHDVQQHLSRCAECTAWQETAATVTRQAILTAPLPRQSRDYAHAVLAADPRSRRPLLAPGVLARTALISAGLVQITVAALLLITDGTHAAREIVAFDMATGLGAIAIATRPIRAEGMVPVLVGLSFALFAGASYDVVTGRASVFAELPHLLVPVELALALRVRTVFRRGGGAPFTPPGFSRTVGLRAA